MKNTYLKWMLRLLPIFYMLTVWLQSKYFNPATIEHRRYIGQLLENGHFLLFAILYGLLVIALMTFGRLTLQKEMIAGSIAIGCAIADEWHQYFIPYRSASLDDMIKNVIGIALMMIMVHLIKKYCQNRQKRC